MELIGKNGRSQPVSGISVVSGKQQEGCKRLDNIPHAVPGWGCCQCHIYNNYARKFCKNCGHVPCYPNK